MFLEILNHDEFKGLFSCVVFAVLDTKDRHTTRFSSTQWPVSSLRNQAHRHALWRKSVRRT